MAKKPAVADFLKPPADFIRNLAKKWRQAKKQSSEISGTIGQTIGKAVDDKHLDRVAFGIACKLNNMSDEKLAITLPHLLAYIDDLGLGERATTQGKLIEEDGDEKFDGDGNVTRIGGAARKVAEQAGEAR